MLFSSEIDQKCSRKKCPGNKFIVGQIRANRAPVSNGPAEFNTAVIAVLIGRSYVSPKSISGAREKNPGNKFMEGRIRANRGAGSSGAEEFNTAVVAVI